MSNPFHLAHSHTTLANNCKARDKNRLCGPETVIRHLSWAQVEQTLVRDTWCIVLVCLFETQKLRTTISVSILLYQIFYLYSSKILWKGSILKKWFSLNLMVQPYHKIITSSKETYEACYIQAKSILETSSYFYSDCI